MRLTHIQINNIDYAPARALNLMYTSTRRRATSYAAAYVVLTVCAHVNISELLNYLGIVRIVYVLPCFSAVCLSQVTTFSTAHHLLCTGTRAHVQTYIHTHANTWVHSLADGCRCI